MKSANLVLLSILGASLLSACSSGSSSSSSNNPTIQYTQMNYSGSLPAGGTTGLTGIRQVGTTSNVYITGSYVVNGLSNGTLYVGGVTGGGTYYVYNYPSSSGATTSGTNVYSADNGSGSNVLLTGTYTTAESGESHGFGFYYNGPLSNTQQANNWQTLVFPESQVPGNLPVGNTYPHSIMGGLIVGNYLSGTTAGNGFIYNIAANSYQSVQYPSARYTTIYGIWWNGVDSYTIAGGYSATDVKGIGVGFVADYNSRTNTFSNWTAYTYNNQPAAITHFEGITTDGANGYNLAAGSEVSGVSYASFVHITRNSSGGFSTNATWTNARYPNSSTTTADTVYQNYLYGVYLESGVSGLNGYAATIPGGYPAN
jgi:hypothetical protein